MKNLLSKITESQLQEGRDHFKVGDKIAVHLKIKEGNRERVQIVSGLVIALKGGGIRTTFTLMRKSLGVNVERVFHLHSPLIEKIEVEGVSRVMRARMYYLRDKVGQKAFKVREVRA